MRILFVASSLGRGGAERQLIVLASGLQDRGHSVGILLLRSEGELADWARRIGLAVELLRTRHTALPVIWATLRSRIRRDRPDVVISYMAAPSVVAALVTPRRGATALVWAVRDSGVGGRYGWRHELASRAARMLRRRPDLIIANSRAGAEHYVSTGYPADRMVVVPNGIDTASFSGSEVSRSLVRGSWGIDDDHFVVGMLARYDPMKGHDDLLTAGCAASRLDARLRFVIIGVPDDVVASLHERVGSARDAFLFLPPTTDPASAMAGFDALVVCSRFGEGFPNVVGEALASGRPVIVTDVGDAALVADRFGEVVPPGGPAELTRSILAVAADPSQYGTPGERRSHIESNYSLHQLTQRALAMLGRAVADRLTRRP